MQHISHWWHWCSLQVLGLTHLQKTLLDEGIHALYSHISTYFFALHVKFAITFRQVSHLSMSNLTYNVEMWIWHHMKYNDLPHLTIPLSAIQSWRCYLYWALQGLFYRHDSFKGYGVLEIANKIYIRLPCVCYVNALAIFCHHCSCSL